jgi:DNA-binding CsgD family transcriptional regulator
MVHSEQSLRVGMTVPALLDVMALLGEVTSDLRLLPEVPRILVSVLPVDRVTFAVVCRTAPAAHRLLVSASFEVPADSASDLLPVAARPRDPVAHDASGIGMARAAVTNASPPASRTSGPAAAPAHHCIEMVRAIDACHEMALNLHYDSRRAPVSSECEEGLDSIADALARALGLLLAWWENPKQLGGRFSSMTKAQWQVLRALCGDRCEKELADDLRLSPHTLHSHIKEIYHKLEARGRLQVVRLLREAVRRFCAGARRGPAHRVALGSAVEAPPAGPVFPRPAIVTMEGAFALQNWGPSNPVEQRGVATH